MVRPTLVLLVPKASSVSLATIPVSASALLPMPLPTVITRRWMVRVQSLVSPADSDSALHQLGVSLVLRAVRSVPVI